MCLCCPFTVECPVTTRLPLSRSPSPSLGPSVLRSVPWETLARCSHLPQESAQRSRLVSVAASHPDIFTIVAVSPACSSFSLSQPLVFVRLSKGPPYLCSARYTALFYFFSCPVLCQLQLEPVVGSGRRRTTSSALCGLLLPLFVLKPLFLKASSSLHRRLHFLSPNQEIDQKLSLSNDCRFRPLTKPL